MLSKHKNLIFYLILFTSFFTFISLGASSNSSNAKSNSPLLGTTEDKAVPKEVRGNLENKKEDFVNAKLERVQEQWQKRCEFLTNRVQNRITKFDENKDLHVERYSALKDKVIGIVQQLENKGYDVEQLAEDLTGLDALIVEYTDEYAEFITLLEATEDYACGESQGDFVQAVKAARDQLRVVHQKRLKIREYYKDVLREDIIEIRKQTAAMNRNNQPDSDDDNDYADVEIQIEPMNEEVE